jgi:plastocyanin
MSYKEMLGVIALLAATVLMIALLTSFGAVSQAGAAPQQQFSIALTDVRPDGQYAVDFKARMFDSTGAVPPPITEFYLRLPAGIRVRDAFRSAAWQCDGRALVDAIHRHPSATPFNARVARLAPLVATLRRGRSEADRRALGVARRCAKARVGSGVAQVDARRMTMSLPDLIPARFSMFLSRARSPRAIGALAIVAAADERAPIVRRNPLLGAVHAALLHDVFDDPTADGRFGYKMMLPRGKINGLDVAIAEVHARVSGVRDEDGFWITRPNCPSSGLIAAQVFTAYVLPTPSSTTTVQAACPRYSAAAAAVGGSAAAVASRPVAVGNDWFSPRVVTIDAGDRVRWTWRGGGRPHNVASPKLGDSGIKTRGSYAMTFRRSGRYPYRCVLHEGMTGTVVVRR